MKRQHLRLRQLLTDRKGTPALEFALVAPAFFLLLLGTFEIALMFLSTVVIEGAAIDAARQLRTGQAQVSINPLETFRTKLCDSLFNIVPCGDLVFDVRNFTSFDSIPTQIQLDEDGNLTNTTFLPGDPGDIVLVRVSYRWNFVTPLVGRLISDNETNSFLLLSSAIFRNEPFRLQL